MYTQLRYFFFYKMYCNSAIIVTIVFFFVITFCESRVLRVDEKFLHPAKYHDYDDLTNLFSQLTENFPGLAKVETIGKSVNQREIWTIHINTNLSNRTLLTPMFKYVANMHGDETVGRELVIYMAQYLLYNYGKDPRVTQLVNNTDIYLVPSMNPDGFENSEVHLCFYYIFNVQL